MMFERVGAGLFRRPRDYPADALVTAGTHDVATVCGFWRGRDLEWRRELGHYPSDASRDDEAAGRIADRRRLIDALIDAGVWPADPPTDCASLEAGLDLVVAVHRFLAATPCRLMMVQVEAALMQVEQVNLPGTIDDHPNWRRRLPVPLERLIADEGVARLLAALRSERPR
jgi:4-alpha-glucanotransferase